MKDKRREELIEILNHKYELDLKYLESLDFNQLEEIYLKKEKEELSLLKNPNKFFYVKGLPVPKEVETKTSEKGGKLIFAFFVLTLLLVLVLFFVLAIINLK
ncbi:hypothetical protein [Mesomycoplasma molare]|uniref:Uncharacterized protein n=1 Tax=Mesomycoplasma molare TaxID=171288 RepID=A0ABY5TTL4_9BACT|nr:hypothetical protein [Mesomycoplasma molare]UWD34012.1 hypothetical protein NX772_02800 [Mesomycoplasma molare]